MHRVHRALAAALFVALLVAPAASARAAQPAWTPYDRPATYGVVSESRVPITMSDGTVLRANIHRPDAPGRFPVLLFQNPYGSNGAAHNDGGASDPYLVQRGYVQVVVDVRGTGESEGSWEPFGPREQRDGYELVEWAATRPWSDGNVGGAGGSYLAIAQLMTAAQRPPHLKAIFPFAPMGDTYRDMVMTGGSVNTSFIPSWVANVAAGMIQPPAGESGDAATLVSHLSGVGATGSELVVEPLSDTDKAYDGPFWGSRSPLEVVDRITVPTFVVGGLHDIFQRGEPLLYERLRRHVPARLLIGPWMHLNYWAGLPADGVPGMHELQLRWYDHWLKGLPTGIASTPPVTQYRWGLGRYVTSDAWPNPRLAPARLYFRGSGRLASQPPPGAEPTQSFQQNPATGICTLSTSQWTAGAAGYLPCANETRPDAALGSASYETEPLADDLVIDGPILADIWMTTTAGDAPITARVIDVAPDGSTTELTDGWLSARFRGVDASRGRSVRGMLIQPWHPFTLDSMLPVEAGEPMRLPVEVFPTNAVIRPGHRLRLTVSSGDFPHQIPPVPALARSLAGTTTILTDPQHPSSLVLPRVGATCARGTLGRSARCRLLDVPQLLRAPATR